MWRWLPQPHMVVLLFYYANLAVYYQDLGITKKVPMLEVVGNPVERCKANALHTPMATDALRLLANTLVGWSLSCTSGAWRVRHCWTGSRRYVRRGQEPRRHQNSSGRSEFVQGRICCWCFLLINLISIWICHEYAQMLMRINRSCPNSLSLSHSSAWTSMITSMILYL